MRGNLHCPFSGSPENTWKACLPQPGTHEQDSTTRPWWGTFAIRYPRVCVAQSMEGRRERELLAKLTPIFPVGLELQGSFQVGLVEWFILQSCSRLQGRPGGFTLPFAISLCSGLPPQVASLLPRLDSVLDHVTCFGQ